MKNIFLIILFIVSSLSHAQSKAPSHDIWNELLKKNVSFDGKVNYKGFIADSVKLNKYLNLLSLNNPSEKTWSVSELKAFWINVYNAFTIKLIIDNYPIQSINDVVAKLKIVGKTTPWDIKFIKIGNETISLNIVEHEKLRKTYGDARFHFALVCAAKSCPILLNESYAADKLEMQLEKQTKLFLNDKFKNNITSKTVKLSKLFEWYASDFKSDKSSIIDFINKYSVTKINPKATISFLEYSWDLNQ